MKVMRSKFRGVCKGCEGVIEVGTTIHWFPDIGAKHPGCDMKINGIQLAELAEKWDQEHAGEPTALERFEQMRVSPEYRDVPEDTIYEYAQQDAKRNPYR